MELAKGSPVLGTSLGSGACLLSDLKKTHQIRGQTKVFESKNLCKLDPCYSKYTLAINQNDFHFIGIYFKAF